MSSAAKDSFTIVIPAYNRGTLLPETLDSVAAQTYRPLHLIVVDNNSSDNTLEVAEKWSESHSTEDFKVTVLEEKERGPSLARNRGLASVDSEWMCFFDSDDLMAPDLVAQIMANRDGVDMVMWRRVRTTLDGSERMNMKFTESPEIRGHLYHAYAATQAFAIRTELARVSGGWDDKLPAWDDWEYGVRILLMNPKIKVIDKTLVQVRAHKDSITGLTFSSKAGLLEKTIEAVRNDIRISGRKDSESLLRIADYRACVLAAHYSREGAKEAGSALYQKTLKNTKWRRMKFILPVLYRFVRLSGRGISVILDPFL